MRASRVRVLEARKRRRGDEEDDKNGRPGPARDRRPGSDQERGDRAAQRQRAHGPCDKCNRAREKESRERTFHHDATRV